MPKLDSTFEEAQESTVGSGYEPMEPGAYMCRVQAVRTQGTDARGATWTASGKQYVVLILDVDEGEHAGKFSDEYWAGEDKDYGHRLYMSWKPSAMGMLKHTFAAFEDANAGFDARAAFEADRWELFVGRRLRVQWNAREYESNRGELRYSVRPDRALTATDKPRTVIELLGGEKADFAEYKALRAAASAAAPAAAYGDDIPF